MLSCHDRLTVLLIAIIMALVNSISAIARSQNETNETDIGGDQSVSGNISAYRSFGPRVANGPTLVIGELDRTVNETEPKQKLNAEAET
jgi:hypothetical protein